VKVCTMDIRILSREGVERYEPEGVEICISIADPDAPPATLSPAFAAVLRLWFSDIGELEIPSDVLFAPEHARSIVDFVKQWPEADRLVVHCHVGISRSPGVALGVCDVFRWPADQLERDYPNWNRWVRHILAQGRVHE
jgi:predicted protein tyrosine phosphatase